MEESYLTVLVLSVLFVFVAYAYGPWSWPVVPTAHRAVKLVNRVVTGEWHGPGLMHIRLGIDDYRTVPVGEIKYSVNLPPLRTVQATSGSIGTGRSAIDLDIDLVGFLRVDDPARLLTSLLAEMGDTKVSGHHDLSIRIFDDRVLELMKGATNKALDGMDYDEIKGIGGTVKLAALINRAAADTGAFDRWGVSVLQPWQVSDVTPTEGVRKAEEDFFAAQLRAKAKERDADAEKYVTEQEAEGEAAALRKFDIPEHGIKLRLYDALRSIPGLSTLIIGSDGDLPVKPTIAIPTQKGSGGKS